MVSSALKHLSCCQDYEKCPVDLRARAHTCKMCLTASELTTACIYRVPWSWTTTTPPPPPAPHATRASNQDNLSRMEAAGGASQCHYTVTIPGICRLVTRQKLCSIILIISSCIVWIEWIIIDRWSFESFDTENLLWKLITLTLFQLHGKLIVVFSRSANIISET